MDPAWIDAHGIASRGRDCLASMGIYLFNRETLVKLLTKTDYHDFGREIFPAAMRTHRVQVHLFDGYWEDIGTIRSFYEANLALAAADRPFDLASRHRADLLAGPLSAAVAHRRRDDPRQPDRRRLRDRRGGRDRKQRDRAALPDRPRRDHSQFDPDGHRRLRKRRRSPRCRRSRPAAVGHRRRHAHRGRDHRQELPHRQATCAIANDRGVETSEETPEAMIRDRHRLRAKGRNPAGRLADVRRSGLQIQVATKFAASLSTCPRVLSRVNDAKGAQAAN